MTHKLHMFAYTDRMAVNKQVEHVNENLEQ